MAAKVVLLACLLLAPVSSMEVSMRSSLTFDAEAAKTTPVNKVVNLLKDMLKTMEKEGKEDQEIYDKMACWCITNKKEKTASVAKGTARVADLTTSIEGYTALSSRLNTENKALIKEVGKDQEALDKSAALRAKQMKTFSKEEAALLESIFSMKSALSALRNPTAKSFLQVPDESGLADTVQTAMLSHGELLQGVLSASERDAVTSFIQDSNSAGAKSSGPSDEIIGILSQMRETFESNLAKSQGQEKTNQKAYEDLKTAKEGEISSGQEQSDTKTQLLADTNEKNAQAKEDLTDTKKALDTDKKFVKMLNEKCKQNDTDWDVRQKDRAAEMEACNKALAVLTSDAAHDLLGKTLGFMQMERSMHSSRRTAASKFLTQAADKLKNPRLATLAVSMRLDVFAKVKKSIDDMINSQLKTKAEEEKLKDFCVDEFNKNDMQKEAADDKKKKDSSKKQDVTAQIVELKADVATLKKDIATMQKEMKRGGEDREKENKEFQMVVADQRATQKLLKSALNVLKGMYAKKALVQESADQAPPPQVSGKNKKSSSGGGVVAMLQQIIWDAKAMEAEAISSEADAQKAYESFVKDTNESVDKKTRAVTNKSATKSKAEGDLVEVTTAKKKDVASLDLIAMARLELHKTCDFVVKNFDVRQSSFDTEVDALKQAKAILSGAKFNAFLQHA